MTIENELGVLEVCKQFGRKVTDNLPGFNMRNHIGTAEGTICENSTNKDGNTDKIFVPLITNKVLVVKGVKIFYFKLISSPRKKIAFP